MAPELTLADMTAVGAHQRGHFRLSSGLHAADYLQCALYLSEPRRAATAGERLAAAARALDLDAQVVVAPALGGVVIGHESARALGLPFLFTERESDGSMALRRGFALAAGARVFLVEDVVTTGRSSREVIALVEAAGAEVVGAGAIVNRSGSEVPFGPLPFVSLLEVELPTWEPTICPLCADGAPLTKPGSRPLGGG